MFQNYCQSGGLPLTIASWKGHVPVVRVLLEESVKKKKKKQSKTSEVKLRSAFFSMSISTISFNPIDAAKISGEYPSYL